MTVAWFLFKMICMYMQLLMCYLMTVTNQCHSVSFELCRSIIYLNRDNTHNDIYVGFHKHGVDRSWQRV